MPPDSKSNESLNDNQSRRRRQSAIFLEVHRLLLDDASTYHEMIRRLQAEGLTYTPTEFAEAVREVHDDISLAVANNSIDGFKLTPAEIIVVNRRALVRSGLLSPDNLSCGCMCLPAEGKTERRS